MSEHYEWGHTSTIHVEAVPAETELGRFQTQGPALVLSDGGSSFIIDSDGIEELREFLADCKTAIRDPEENEAEAPRERYSERNTPPAKLAAEVALLDGRTLYVLAFYVDYLRPAVAGIVQAEYDQRVKAENEGTQP